MGPLSLNVDDMESWVLSGAPGLLRETGINIDLCSTVAAHQADRARRFRRKGLN